MADRTQTGPETEAPRIIGVAVPKNGKAHEHENRQDKPPTPIYRRTWFLIVAAAVLVALLVFGIRYWLYWRLRETTDDAFVDGHAVQIGPRVPGYVVNLRVDDNQFVKKDDTLLEIDPRDYEAALEQAQAAEAVAQGKLAQSQSQVTAAQAAAKAAAADVVSAEAALANASQILTRGEELARSKAIAEQDLITFRTQALQAQSQVRVSKANLASAEAQVDLARSGVVAAQAQVRQAAAQVRSARLNLSYTKLLAPIDGRVTFRKVELGDYLQPGQPLFALVAPDVWVTANFKETQLTDMKVGQPVGMAIDAYPGVRFDGHVDSFQRGSGARFSLLPAENATGNYVKVVQRVPVKLVFDHPPGPDRILGLGMSVVPVVRVR